MLYKTMLQELERKRDFEQLFAHSRSKVRQQQQDRKQQPSSEEIARLKARNADLEQRLAALEQELARQREQHKAEPSQDSGEKA